MLNLENNVLPWSFSITSRIPGIGLWSRTVQAFTLLYSMMMCFSLLSFLPMKKIGETYCNAPSLICPSAFSCLIHISSISPSALEHGYGLHLIEVGASGRNLTVMFRLWFGGNRFESSSENTFQCCLNSLGIV